MLGDRVLGHQMKSERPPRVGNRHLFMAPHNCYPCRGEDNRYVLGELLGLPEQEIAELEKEKVISHRPLD